MAVNHANTRRTNWDMTLGAHDLGGVDAVTPNFDLVLDPVKIGSLGKMKLDDRFVGLDDNAHIAVEVREVTRTRIEKMLPWFGGSANADINLTPTVNALMTTHAAQLTLHPRDKGATDTEDLVFWKAVPIQSYKLPRNGQEDDKWLIIIRIYPDLTKAAGLEYGQVGAA